MSSFAHYVFMNFEYFYSSCTSVCDWLNYFNGAKTKMDFNNLCHLPLWHLQSLHFIILLLKPKEMNFMVDVIISVWTKLAWLKIAWSLSDLTHVNQTNCIYLFHNCSKLNVTWLIFDWKHWIKHLLQWTFQTKFTK